MFYMFSNFHKKKTCCSYVYVHTYISMHGQFIKKENLYEQETVVEKKLWVQYTLRSIDKFVT